MTTVNLDPDEKIAQVPTPNEMNMSTHASSANAVPKSTKTTDSDVIIAVMGATGTGKTTFINLASGSNLEVGMGLESCTSEVQVTQPFALDGRSVTLIDTPGFDDTEKSDFDILNLISKHLSNSYKAGTKLAGVVYIHRISDFRFGGIAAKNFKMFRQLCGDSTLKNVVIVTNMWGEVTKEKGEARAHQLANQEKFFKPVLDKKAQMLRHFDTTDSAHKILRNILKNQPEALQIQKEMVDQKKDISQTAAGIELNHELQELMKKHKEEMTQLRTDIEEAVKMRDEETRRELAEESRKLEEKLERVRIDTEKLTSQYREEKRQMELALQREREDAKRQQLELALEREREAKRQMELTLQREREEAKRQQLEVALEREREEKRQWVLQKQRDEEIRRADALQKEREKEERIPHRSVLKPGVIPQRSLLKPGVIPQRSFLKPGAIGRGGKYIYYPINQPKDRIYYPLS